MKYNAQPDPCETFTWGEVEDYTINISDPIACPSNVVENGNYTNGTTEVIESSTYIHSDATIETGANIIFDATDHIELQPNFIAEPGCEFQAIIEGCGGATTLNNENEGEH